MVEETFKFAEQGTLLLGSLLIINMIILGFIGIWSFGRENVQGIAILSIFGFLVLSSLLIILVLGGFENLFSGDLTDSWSKPSFFLIIGYTIGVVLASINNTANGYSLLSIGKTNLLATLASQLPRQGEFIINAFMVPVVEEFFFMIAIPLVLFTGMNLIGKKYSVFDNDIVQLLIVLIISGFTFFIFHVGKLIFSFAIASIIFRSVTILLFWGDQQFDWYKWGTVTASITIGLHIGNNWGTYGFINGWGLLISEWYGILLVLFFALIVIGASDYLISKKG